MDCVRDDRELENRITFHLKLKKKLLAMIPVGFAVGALTGIVVKYL
jgi:hypothetical protein